MRIPKKIITTLMIGVTLTAMPLNVNANIDTHSRNFYEPKPLIKKSERDLLFEKIKEYYMYDSKYLSPNFLDFIDKTLKFYKINDRIPLEIFLALIDTESRFDHESISDAGAFGLTQIMKNTEKIINEEYKNWLSENYLKRENPYDNITISVIYLNDLLRRHDNNLEATLRFYNGGSKWKTIKNTKIYYERIMIKAKLLKDYLYEHIY